MDGRWHYRVLRVSVGIDLHGSLGAVMGEKCIKEECVAYRHCNPWGNRPYCEWASSKYERLVWIEEAEKECGESE